jgi:Pectate lyase superfamily protein/Major tropism determinant N-terminal domain
MAIVQISRIQQRRGLQQDLPQLAGGEFGWSVDTRRLFIGNGTLQEGAPELGTTEILTNQTPILSFLKTYTFKGLSAGYQVVTGPTGTQPIVRTLQDKIDDIVSVKDFGATGDGVTDDSAAIQRALDSTYATNQITFTNNYHKTIYFPAGTYIVRSTLLIPPYSSIRGENKKGTIIKGNISGPVVQFKDGYGHTGQYFGQPTPIINIVPSVSEYHISDITILQSFPTSTSLANPCLQIDGCYHASFNNVAFVGSLSHNSTTNYYDIDRGANSAAVCMNNASLFRDISNVVFSQCDFFQHNYGIEINQNTHGVRVTDCFFDNLWSSVVIGYTSTSSTPYDISLRGNYFRYSAVEAIKCYNNVTKVMSIGNSFTNAGLKDYESSTHVINVTGIAQTPVITYNSNNNYSIADSFNRTDSDYAVYPNVQTNGYDCYIVGQDLGIVNGKQTSGRGHKVTLNSASTYTSVGVSYIPSNYSNLTMDYSLTSNGCVRTGKLTIASIGGTFNVSDDFSETGGTDVYFQANTSTGDIEYIATSSTTLTYSIKYFTA